MYKCAINSGLSAMRCSIFANGTFEEIFLVNLSNTNQAV